VTSVISPDGNGHWLEYAGGYSDMVAQRRDAAKAVGSAGKPSDKGGAKNGAGKSGGGTSGASGGGAGKGGSSKLSFKQKFALENLPKEIAKLEAAIAKAEAEIADPALFTKNPDRFAKLAAGIDRDRAALAKAEDDWLELEMVRAEAED